MNRRPHRPLVAVLVVLSIFFLASSTPAQVAPQSTSTLVMDLTANQERFAPVDAVVKNAILQGHMPGAVVIVGHDGKVVYRKAFGSRSLDPTIEPMTVDTVFDMASLTKVMATTSSVMRLVQLGQIKLNDPVAKYIPEFAQNGKEDVTIRQLLAHYSGLRPDLDLKPEWTGQAEAFRLANAEKLLSPPGSTFLYSDINFIVLGELVQRVSGLGLNQYAEGFVFSPLGMTTTRYLPPQSWFLHIAPTEKDERSGIMLRGVVHDPTARQMGGVAGHAGLFSTADDTAKFAQALLNGGSPVWSRLIVEKMTTPQQPPNLTVVRGLGWDIDSPFSSNRGELLPVGSYGHTGFTGTSLWIDPTTDTYIVLLTNAVHLKQGNVIALRTEVATAVAAALQLNVTESQKVRSARITGYNEAGAASRRIVTRNGDVKTGIDQLEEQNFGALKVAGVAKPRVGVITNQTGVDSQGKRTIDVLAHAPNVQLTAVFSPEHGLQGTADTTDVANSKDAATGVTVYSVYGDSDAKRRPSPEVLHNLDVLVFDVQDAGARFYTYEATLGYFLEAAAKAGKPIVVLDRPNPVNGAYVQGPVSDAGQESFVNYHNVVVRHGMTIGELAKLYNGERRINANLTVVPMKGWMRGDWFDSTGLEWVNPSPNLRDLEQAILYPGVALVSARTDLLKHAMEELERSYNLTLEALGDALDLKDAETEGHSKRVTAFTMAIARAMELPRERRDVISRGAFLHDIGKMAIPDAILRKPGRLSPEEQMLMREHAYLGYQMLRKIPFLQEAANIVYSHQERYDGSGYPRGLKGDQIPLGARIFAVADTFDAITSDRPYRAAQSIPAARREIQKYAGRQFDPAVVETFMSISEELWQRLRDEIDNQSAAKRR